VFILIVKVCGTKLPTIGIVAILALPSLGDGIGIVPICCFIAIINYKLVELDKAVKYRIFSISICLCIAKACHYITSMSGLSWACQQQIN
jgi:hypothetical protein